MSGSCSRPIRERFAEWSLFFKTGAILTLQGLAATMVAISVLTGLMALLDGIVASTAAIGGMIQIGIATAEQMLQAAIETIVGSEASAEHLRQVGEALRQIIVASGAALSAGVIVTAGMQYLTGESGVGSTDTR
jgi:hypothetical protein